MGFPYLLGCGGLRVATHPEWLHKSPGRMNIRIQNIPYVGEVNHDN